MKFSTRDRYALRLMVELANHPWFVAGQFHPELKSRPNKAHPLFRGFVGAAKAYKNRHE